MSKKLVQIGATSVFEGLMKKADRHKSICLKALQRVKDGIRTRDPRNHNPMLYPTELLSPLRLTILHSLSIICKFPKRALRFASCRCFTVRCPLHAIRLFC